MSEFLIFNDVETTGFCPVRNDVVSAAFIVTDKKLDIKDKFYIEVRPEFNKFYSERAEEIHGFNKEKLKTFMPRKEACIKILTFLKPFKDPKSNPRPFIFHANRNFDYKFIDQMFRKESLQYSLWKVIEGGNLISTLKMARAANYKSNKLSEWASRLGVDLIHHNAMSDTNTCLEIYKHLTRSII